MPRIDGRRPDELRPVTFTPDFLAHPTASVMIACGGTKVLTAATFENKVPGWMKTQQRAGGWITCEYGMLPAATGERTKREAVAGKQGGRTVEIQRLIGRSLRMGADLSQMGERTLYLDCDVIDADGGTRCASITAASVASALAFRRTAEAGKPVAFREMVAAISVGVVDGIPLLDLCYEEDSRAEVDMNVVMSESGKIIEIQGTAEKVPFDRNRLNELLNLADSGLKRLFLMQREALLRAK